MVAILLRSAKLRLRPLGLTLQMTQLRRQHWNYQYQPRPYPKTPEERKKAAKFYDMSVTEYQPLPESMGMGDYPRVPDIGADSKDPHYPYDMPELKRNYKEPMHWQSEIIGEDRYDISMRPRFPVWYQALWLFTVLAAAFSLYFWLETMPMGRPVCAKQYPGEGAHFDFPKCGQ